MKLVMFDIDGTLTQSVDVDEACFVRALQEVFGFAGINTDWASYPHCSDSGILEELFQRRLGRSPTLDEVRNIQSHFLSLLTAATVGKPLSQVCGVEQFVRALIGSPGFAVSLASGGWECSARLKLASAGLDFVDIPAAFADTAHAREDIMRASFAKAAQSYSRESFDAVIYIGDGVWDARAAHNLGYRSIGISHDPIKTQKLKDEGVSYVFCDYRDSDLFMTALRKSIRM